MDSKLIILSLVADLLLIYVSIIFMYLGISSNQIVLSIIGGLLLFLGIVRLIIFAKTFHKHGDE